MSKFSVKAHLVMRDGGDGSQSCELVGSRQEAIEALGYSSEEEMQEKWECWYENGGFSQIEIEIEEKDGIFVITKGDYVSTDDMESMNR